MAVFYPANTDPLILAIIQDVMDSLHKENIKLAQKILTMEARRANLSLNVMAE